MTWRARLKGHSFDFDILGRLFRDGDPTVGSDDEGFYLTSTSFDEADDVGEVHERAARLLCDVNGVARVLDASYRNVELAGHYVDDEGKSAFVEAATVTARGQVDAVVSVGTEPQTPRPPRGPRYVALALTDTHVAEALRYVASDLDTVRVRKAYEVIEEDVEQDVEEDVGGPDALVAAGLATNTTQLSQFRAPLTDPDVSGEDAIHARRRRASVRNPMDLSEARRFLLDLLRRWMDWKLRQS